MPYVVRLAGYRPLARASEPWSAVLIEEAPAQSGPWTELVTLDLDPLDADPLEPQVRDFEIETATLADGWYRVTWLDATGDRSATDAVRRVRWAPSVDDIARVMPAYTVGPYLGEDEQAGAQRGTFTDATEPTAAAVAALIAAACDEVRGRVGLLEIPERHHDLARMCVVWHVAADIAATKSPANSDDSRGEYQGHIANFRASLDRLVQLCERPGAVRLA